MTQKGTQVTFRYLSVSGCEASQLNKSAALGSLMVPLLAATVEARAHGEPSKCLGPRYQRGGALCHLTHPCCPISCPIASGRGWRCHRTNPLPLGAWRCLPPCEDSGGGGDDGEQGREGGAGWKVRSLIGPGRSPAPWLVVRVIPPKSLKTRRRRFWSLPAHASLLVELWKVV